MIIREIFPICDVCEEVYPDNRFRTNKQCIEYLRGSGWKANNKRQVCPRCVDQKNPGKPKES